MKSRRAARHSEPTCCCNHTPVRCDLEGVYLLEADAKEVDGCGGFE